MSNNMSDEEADGCQLISKVYTNVCVNRDASYSDYDNYVVKWSEPEMLDKYEAICKIGRGKYSDVFEGVFTVNAEPVVLKMLKPVKAKKILREVLILQNLYGGPNIIKLLDVIRDPVTLTPTLVFEHVKNTDFKVLYPKLNLSEIAFYMYQLMIALEFSHSQGIMHRDVKPHNIVIDHANRKLRLIDWGLAEFYFPGREYNVRVASRYFKGPELLVDHRDYDYALDLWGFGCVLAGIIFRQEPFFFGKNNQDQLVKIAKVLGTDALVAYLEKYDLNLDSSYEGLIGQYSKKNWKIYINNDNSHLCTEDALDLVDRCLRFDPAERITAGEALKHPFFAAVK